MILGYIKKWSATTYIDFSGDRNWPQSVTCLAASFRYILSIIAHGRRINFGWMILCNLLSIVLLTCLQFCFVFMYWSAKLKLSFVCKPTNGFRSSCYYYICTKIILFLLKNKKITFGTSTIHDFLFQKTRQMIILIQLIQKRALTC